MTLHASVQRSPSSFIHLLGLRLGFKCGFLAMCFVGFLILSHLLCTPVVNAAPNTKQLAKAAFKKGKDAFDSGQYPEALEAFDEAYQHFPLPLMLFNIANVYERLQLLPQAISNYKSFIKTGKDANGEAKKKLETLESTLQDWPEVLFTSSPSGAMIRLHSKKHPILGQTPFKQKVRGDTELPIFLTPTEGDIIEKVVTIKATPPRQTININLPKKAAYIRVIGSPKNTQVRNGYEKLNGLPALLKLSVGDQEIELSAPGYLPIKRSLSLRSVHTKEAPLTLEVDLKSSEGVALVALNVSVDGALLFIDGLPQGQSPFNDPIQLTEGEHFIELKGPQGQSFQETLSIRAGETTQLSVDFNRSESFLTRDQMTIGLMSLGGASLLTGLVLGGIALNANGNLEECRTHELCSRRQGEIDRAQAVRAYSLSADILTSLGLLISGTGGVLYWLDHRSSPITPPLKPSLQLGSLPGGASLNSLIHF